MVSTRKTRAPHTASPAAVGAAQHSPNSTAMPNKRLSRASDNSHGNQQRKTRNNNNAQSKAASPSAINLRNPQPAQPMKSLAERKADIQALLPDTVAIEFTNMVNHITRLGGRKPRLLEARLEKLRDIVMRNRQIVGLYNAYAAMQVRAEKRLTYRLPMFLELEGGEAGNTQTEGAEDVDSTEGEKVLEGPTATNDTTNLLALLHKSVVGGEQARDNGRVSQQNSARSEEDTDTETQSSATLMDDMMDGIGGFQESVGHDTNDTAEGLGKGSQQTEKSFHQRAPKTQFGDSQRAGETNASNHGQKQPEASQPTDVHQQLSAASHASKSSQPTLSGHNCDQHTVGHCSIIPVQNPEEFPIHRIQEVQAQYYPSTTITEMWVHRDANGAVTQVTADLDGGSVDHLLINNARLISVLGLRHASQDILSIQPSDLHIEETFKIKILPGQPKNDPKAWLVGELVPARHAYLYWLDSRRSADPKTPPSMQEARIIAGQLGRRMADVWREVKRMWDLEQGSGGRQFRDGRERWLGESPSYRSGEERKQVMAMWG